MRNLGQTLYRKLRAGSVLDPKALNPNFSPQVVLFSLSSVSSEGLSMFGFQLNVGSLYMLFLAYIICVLVNLEVRPSVGSRQWREGECRVLGI